MKEEKFKWKCDICGTRFNNFQAEGFNRKIYCPLCFFKELNNQNEQQLQVYKDKEDMLREYCNEQGKDMTKLESIFTGEETKEYVLLNGFLQILNDKVED